MDSPDSDLRLLDELADEFAERCRRGERPSIAEYVERYPQLADDIRQLFPAMAEIEDVKEAESPAEPATGAIAPYERLGDYRIIREVGRGGMGVVYEAEQTSLGRRVALKVLLSRRLETGQKRRFEREARAAAKLHHTNIVPVFGVGEHDGMPYYVMQFIAGRGLDEVIAELRHLRGAAARDGTAASRGAATGDGPETSRVPASVAASRRTSAARIAESLVTGRFSSPAPVEDEESPPLETTTLLKPGLDSAPLPPAPRRQPVSACRCRGTRVSRDDP